MTIKQSEIRTGAELSSCGMYRYSLWREWDYGKGTCVFIGLNPSTADAVQDDPTITRCIRFAQAWGYNKMVMVNLFAFRATNRTVMKKADEPIGYDNDRWLLQECAKADLVVAAWSNDGVHRGRGEEVKQILSNQPMKCFSLTVKAQPIHPLYQKADASLIEFE